MTARRILLLEDDADIALNLVEALTGEGHAVDHAWTIAEARTALSTGQHALAVLDRMVPDGDASIFCRALRATGDGLMILMLTARDGIEDRVAGLRAGADDYLTKPFALEELFARVEALLRRSERNLCETVADVTLDQANQTVTRNGRVIALTATEFRLLQCLMLRPGEPLSRDTLLKEVWDYDFDPGTNIVEVYIAYLRRKMEGEGLPRRIHTIRGYGYSFSIADIQ
jgi:DNA-binding response OmpR family regulator